MSYKLYVNDRCIMEVEENPGEEIAKKPCNCPNCGAPISSYICEYCGTKFGEDPIIEQIQIKKDEISKLQNDLLLSTLNASMQQQSQAMHTFLMSGLMSPLEARQASQADIWRMQQANIYASTQTMISDQMAALQTNVYPINHDICQQIPINKDGDFEDIDASKTTDELVNFLLFCIVGMIVFTLFCIGVTVIYNLF